MLKTYRCVCLYHSDRPGELRKRENIFPFLLEKMHRGYMNITAESPEQAAMFAAQDLTKVPRTRHRYLFIAVRAAGDIPRIHEVSVRYKPQYDYGTRSVSLEEFNSFSNQYGVDGEVV